MPTSPVQYSSKTEEWGSPPHIVTHYARLHNVWHDVCATPGRQVFPSFFSPEQDGLAQSWGHLRCWMNPPYGRPIRDWIKKAHDETRVLHRCPIVVALLPVRTDTAWWHDFIQHKADVRFIRGRLKFTDTEGKAKWAAPFPSCIAIWTL